MKFCFAYSKLVACGSIALLFSAGSALGQGAAQPSGIPFHPSALKKAPPPAPPKHGLHKIDSHGKATHAAVAKYAAESCDHLAHHFVGTVSHDAFMTECNHGHHAVMTHVQPHPDTHKAAGGAPAPAPASTPAKSGLR